MNLPIKDHLSQQDLIQWSQELISYFLIPVALVFLTSLQSGSFQVALGAAYGTALACAISLLSKYKSGLDPKDIANLQKNQLVQPETPSVVNVQQPDPAGK